MAKATRNDRLLDSVVRNQIRLLRLGKAEAARIAALLDDLDRRLVDRIATQSAKGELASATSAERLLAEFRALRRDVIVGKAGKELGRTSRALAKMEVANERERLGLGIDLRTEAVSASLVRSAANARIQGIKVEGWLRNVARADALRLERTVKSGILTGLTPRQMVRQLQGETGTLAQTKRAMEAVVRTAVNTVSNQARQQVWSANKDIISGLRWTATLDGRTSEVCMARDGEVYPVDEGPRPPAHFNCRSVMVPVIDGVAVEGMRPEVTADSIGTVPAGTTYDEWLRRQPASFQDEVLGKGKADRFREGMTLDKFVDAAGRPIALKDL